jgi:hypothetical protein
MSSVVKRYASQWGAQFSVAGELCKLNYEVSFTMGNATPLADLMVVSPNRRMFLVDVKGQQKGNFWLIRDRAEIQADLYYVLALVPPGKPNRYFVLNHAAAHDLMQAHKASGAKSHSTFTGFNWTACHAYENRWDLLPQ